eukprot:m.471883 g.471883  ORF g.471883 m.471883 type:complete len:301 (-) comp20379_c1_seq3:3353-4255(-)
MVPTKFPIKDGETIGFTLVSARLEGPLFRGGGELSRRAMLCIAAVPGRQLEPCGCIPPPPCGQGRRALKAPEVGVAEGGHGEQGGGLGCVQGVVAGATVLLGHALVGLVGLVVPAAPVVVCAGLAHHHKPQRVLRHLALLAADARLRDPDAPELGAVRGAKDAVDKRQLLPVRALGRPSHPQQRLAAVLVGGKDARVGACMGPRIGVGRWVLVRVDYCVNVFGFGLGRVGIAAAALPTVPVSPAAALRITRGWDRLFPQPASGPLDVGLGDARLRVQGPPQPEAPRQLPDPGHPSKGDAV